MDFFSSLLNYSILSLHLSFIISPLGTKVVVLSSTLDGLIIDLEAFAVEGEATASMITGYKCLTSAG
jgi:hypothetical protein